MTAPSDDLPGTGFTIDLHTKDNSKNDIIAVWSPTEEVTIREFDMYNKLYYCRSPDFNGKKRPKFV